MTKHQKILTLIIEISNANPIMEDIFLYGSCFNFFFILRTVFPESKAYYGQVEGHVVTEIDGHFYDITGEVSVKGTGYVPIGDIWGDGNPYNDEKTYKLGDMYGDQKTKYIRDIRNWSGYVSKCHESELITISGDEGTGYYVCKECGKPCDIQ